LRISSAHFIVCLIGLQVFPALCSGQAKFDPKKHDRWARFDVGAWSRLREVAESFDEEGKLVQISTTETTTRLAAADDQSVTLETNVTVEIAGRRFDAQPELVKKNFLGADEGKTVKVEEVGEGQVTIGEEQIPCRIRRLTVNGGSDTQVTTIYFNDEIAPYELRRETDSTDVATKAVKYQTNVTVIAMNLPFNVLTEIQTVAFIRTLHTAPNKKKMTVEVHCPRVPGGVVGHWSTETDDKGRVVYRSILELADYGYTSPVEETDTPTGRVLLPRRSGRIGSKP
jgi:hypothetical protein